MQLSIRECMLKPLESGNLWNRRAESISNEKASSSRQRAL
jgi:BarA-like signal transduction histidine kinase